MKIDADAVVQKLITQIANLHLQVAILQAEKEALQGQLKKLEKKTDIKEDKETKEQKG